MKFRVAVERKLVFRHVHVVEAPHEAAAEEVGDDDRCQAEQ